jgi:hypothetical protein
VVRTAQRIRKNGDNLEVASIERFLTGRGRRPEESSGTGDFRAARYTAGVRAVLAVLLAGVLVAMTTADRLVCPDGCTDAGPAQTSPREASPDCAICHGWSHTLRVMAARPAPIVCAAPLPAVTAPTPPALATLDPPPKNA